MAQQPDPATLQTTMTLAALASTGAAPRPSGETLQQQSERILRGLSAQLSEPHLATNGTWVPVWLALSPDNANMAYIARNTDGSNQFAVVTRGTIANLTDITEDFEVGTVVPFTASGSPTPVAVSQGAMEAFTQVTNARSITSAMPGVTLVQALATALHDAPASPQPTVYVAGHSLGGCLATMVAPYLQAQQWANPPQFALITFAAPTAGLRSFADYVDSIPWSVFAPQANAYDLIPLAWSDLKAAEGWYPKPGPAATFEVKVLLEEITALANGNAYVQPGTPNQWNSDYTQIAENLVNNTTEDFLAQGAFQHADSTYLSLVGANPLAPAPAVTAVTPPCGEPGITVTISGSGFAPDSVVDFGPIPCAEFSIDQSGTQITATVPDGVGIVDLYVTTMLGTSPSAPLGQFAYGGPAPVVVSALGPVSGKVGAQVVISGSGFAQGASVQFNGVPAHEPTVDSANQITANAPLQLDDSQTVDVTVTVGVATSRTGPADEFTYTGI